MKFVVLFAALLFSCSGDSYTGAKNVPEEIPETAVRVSEYILYSAHTYPDFIYSVIIDSTICISVVANRYKTINCYYPITSSSIYCGGYTIKISFVDAEKIVFTIVKNKKYRYH